MIDLKSAVGPRKGSIEFPAIEATKTQSDALARIYLRVIRLWRDHAARILERYDPPNPNVVRDSVDEVDAQIAAATAEANAVIVALSYEVDNWVRLLTRWHRDKWARNVKSRTGITIDQFLTNDAVLGEMRASLKWNVALIRNISDQARDRIANIVWAGWREGTPRREIAKRINEAVALGRKRSLRVAVDQATKLSADLDRARMLEAGIEDWVWIHSKKRNPRHQHVERNGREYNWITNRPADLPGHLPYCGCKARALLKFD